MQKGIAVAGNMIVDNIKMIDQYPGKSELTRIREMWHSSGGAVSNTIMSLARLDPDLPLKAIGHVGKDEDGDYLLDCFGHYDNIDISMVQRNGRTSFTDAMTEISSKMRTFFAFSGSDQALCEEDLMLDHLDADILHMGYILLLSHMDEEDAKYGTRMARALAHAQEKGIRTSIDVVSERGTRFLQKVPPALRYCDYCIINEFEASMITGVRLRDEEERMLVQNAASALEKLQQMGVSRWIVIHTPEFAFGLNENNQYIAKPCLLLPDGFIQGTTGAGDAFCAGVLYSAYREFSLPDALDCGMATAAASLRKGDANSGIDTWTEVQKLLDLPRQNY